MPGDGSDTPSTSTTEAPPSRRARRVTPDTAVVATAVADPLLAADAAAAEAAEKDAAEPSVTTNGDHPSTDAKTEAKTDGKANTATDTGPLPVTTATKPPAKPSNRSAKRAKAAKKAAAGTTAAAAAKTAVADDELPPTQAVEAVVADAGTETAVQPTPSNGVPMVALVPPGALTEPTPVIDTPTETSQTATSPTVTAPTAAAVAAATVAVPVVATPQKEAKAPKPAAAPKGQKVAAAPRRRVRARRVQRIVRRVDAWSVMKISFIFFIVMYLVLLVAGVLLWAFAVGTGTIDNVENFIEQLFALDSFSFVGEQILRASVAGGAILVIAGTFTTTVLAVLFNLISDLVGGVRFTVVEEQVLRPVAPKPSPAATPPATTPTPTVDGSASGPGTV